MPRGAVSCDTPLRSVTVTVYVKLFGSILDSSIWAEEMPTRIVWITMLAMADAEGIVHASPSGLARRACVTPAECKAALKVLMAPDVESKSQEYGGRRIERVDGGWILLNYKKYRELRTRQQVMDAARQRRHRKTRRKKRDTSRDSVTDPDVTTEVEVEVDVDAVLPSNSGRVPEPPSELTDPLHREAWTRLCRASGNPDAWAASVTAIGTGMHPPSFPWPVIGQALADMSANGDRPNIARLRGCCGRLTSPPASRQNGRETPKQELARMAREAREEENRARSR